MNIFLMWNIFILPSIDYPATDLENIPSDRRWLVLDNDSDSFFRSAVQTTPSGSALHSEWAGNLSSGPYFSPWGEGGWSEEDAKVSLPTS